MNYDAESADFFQQAHVSPISSCAPSSPSTASKRTKLAEDDRMSEQLLEKANRTMLIATRDTAESEEGGAKFDAVSLKEAVESKGTSPKDCPCCLMGLNSSASEAEFPQLHAMWTMYEEMKYTHDLHDVAAQISKFWFQVFIVPSEKDPKIQNVLSPWSIETVYEHLAHHITDLSMSNLKDMRITEDVIRLLKDSCFSVDKNTNRVVPNLPNLLMLEKYIKIKAGLYKAVVAAKGSQSNGE